MNPSVSMLKIKCMGVSCEKQLVSNVHHRPSRMLIAPDRKFFDMKIIGRGSANRRIDSCAYIQPRNTTMLVPITANTTARGSRWRNTRASMLASDASHDVPGRRRGSPPEPPPDERWKSGEGWERDRSEEREGPLSDRRRGMRDHTHAAMTSPDGAA